MNFKKYLVFFLAVIMLVSVVSCRNNNEPEQNSGPPTSDSIVPPSTEDRGKLDDPHKTYGGTEINVYAWQGYSTEFITNEEEAYINQTSQAVWERDLFVQEKLDVTLNYFIAEFDHDAFMNILEASVLAGDALYDFVIQYNRNAGAGTLRGLYLNLKTNNEICLEEDYWAPTLTERVSLGDRVYFATGDIMTTTISNTYCVHYNKDILTDRGLEDPYDLVQNNQWTWEKVFEMTRDTYIDTGDAADGFDDTYGIVFCQNGVVDAMYVSAGLKYLEKNEAGRYSISDDFRSDKAATFVSYLRDQFEKDENFIAPTFDWVAYPHGRSLFSVYTAGAVGTIAQGGVVKRYGVAPLPKYDTQQDRYYANLANNYKIVSIPFDCPNFEAAGAVMEFMAVYSKQYVSPAIFEQGFQFKYSESPEDAYMFELIRASSAFDPGLIYVDAFQYAFARSVRGMNEWGSHSLQVAESTEALLIPIMDDLSGLKH